MLAKNNELCSATDGAPCILDESGGDDEAIPLYAASVSLVECIIRGSAHLRAWTFFGGETHNTAVHPVYSGTAYTRMLNKHIG